MKQIELIDEDSNAIAILIYRSNGVFQARWRIGKGFVTLRRIVKLSAALAGRRV